MSNISDKSGTDEDRPSSSVPNQIPTQEVGKMAAKNDTTQEFNDEEKAYFEQILKLVGDEKLAKDYVRRRAAEAKKSNTTNAVVQTQTAPQTPQQSRSVKSVSDYIAEAFALDEEEARSAGAIGYMARALVQATMPHSRVEGSEFERRNGSFFISMLAPSRIGLPYGPLPRLIMAWMTGEAVRTKSRELILGDNLSAFMWELHLIPTGGRWGSITRLKNQMNRLLACSVTCTYDEGNHFALKHITPVEDADLWWDPKDPNQQSLWQSTLTLSARFFEEITNSPIPICMKTLEALRGSSMALDVYCWLTYRNFYARCSSRIPWEALQMQFGAGYPDTTRGKLDFKRNFVLALKKVGVVYPEAQKLQVKTDVLVYIPGFPDVAPLVPKET